MVRWLPLAEFGTVLPHRVLAPTLRTALRSRHTSVHSARLSSRHESGQRTSGKDFVGLGDRYFLSRGERRLKARNVGAGFIWPRRRP